jgi:RNA recognition motif-containing protein
MNIYVGNLSLETTEPELLNAFEKYGEVTKVNIVMGKVDGKPKGFGFVDMSSDEHSQAAIAGLNGKDLGGRALNVNEARPRTDK